MDLTEKYRPSSFDDVLGNEENIQVLKKLVKSENHPHSFLFYGSHGCGKTTLARILSKEFNCQEVIEINSSNNRGIDTIRQLIDDSQFETITGGNKCYILDEFHQSTKDSQNAILKILEEPPKHIYFMICTTDPQKLLPTIKSRCTKIEVEKVDNLTLLSYLFAIARKEGKEISKKICRKIAETSDCHIRDGLKILEKVLTIDDEEKQLKIAESKLDSENQVIDLCKALLQNNNWNNVKEILKNLDDDIEKIRYAVLGYMSTVLLNSNDKGIQAAIVIDFFKEPFYNSGKAGLILACYNIFS